MTLTDYVKKHPAITCLIAGIIYSVQFWSDYTFIFALPGLALYFFALFSCKRKAFFRYSYLFCLGFYIPLYYWFSALYPFEGFGFSAAERYRSATGFPGTCASHTLRENLRRQFSAPKHHNIFRAQAQEFAKTFTKCLQFPLLFYRGS